MKKIMKRLLTGVLSLATVFTALPISQVQAAENKYWTDAQEKAGYVEKVMNDGSIGSTFHEGIMTVEGETAYCIDINTDFQSGYKSRSDASTRMSADQIADVALSLEYVKQYAASHKELNYKQVYLLEQCVVWQRLSVHLGWSCDHVRAAYDEVSKAVQDEVYAGARAFVKANKGRYDCGGYIYSGDGQELGQFWAKLDVGNAELQKVSSNTSITKGNNSYSLAGATYGVFADKGCKEQLATLTTDNDGNTEVVEVKAGKVYIKELSVPAAGFQLDKTVYSLTVKAGETATLKVSDTPKVTTTLIELFKIDMETSKSISQGAASLEGAEFVWNYYDGYYNKDNLPAKPTRTWTTKTVAEKGSDGTTHYITKLADSYKVSGDSFYLQDGVPCLPLGTLTVSESKSPTGYLLEGAYMQANGSEEQIKGMYLAQITEDGELAVLTGGNQYSVSDKVIRGGVKIQKRDLETKDTKPQGGATLKDTEFTITSLNESSVLVDGKLYHKNEVVKTILTGIDGIASTAVDTLPYGTYRLDESKSPTGYLTTGAVSREFTITENGKIVDLTGKDTSIYNQIKRGDIEGVKIGDGTHKRLGDVPFKITSKTTGESHIVVTDKNGQFSTASDWVSHKQNTNRGKTSEDGIWFGTSEPDDTKGALLYDTYEIEELRCDSNKDFKLIPAFEIVVSKDKAVIDLGTLTDDYEKEISIHTTAADKATGEKSIVAGKEVTIVDTVTLDGLKKGTKYQLKGWQMVKDENAELLIDGKRVESDYTFTADGEEMKVKVEYTFNASALGGKDLVTFEELYDLSDKDEPVKVAEHKDIEDDGQTVTITERVIKIHTTAADKATGEKSIVAGKEVTIVDTVMLNGLEVGTKYQLKGWQMVKDENAELLIDGKRVEGDCSFTADSEEMKVAVAFTFNASVLDGKNLVTFEELYDITNPDEPVKVTEHKDIEDEGQTVLITERIIKIHTTAASKDGEKTIEAGKDVTIVDTVTLDGLEVGTKYQLKGWQMGKDKNAELLIDGKRIENDYTFTATDTKMEVEIVFTFDASKLGGQQLVTFEELYDITNPDEPVKVTEHKDIEDKGQAVTIKEVPETPAPEEPEKPQTPDTPSHKTTDSPKTGDSTNVAAFAILLGLSAAGIGFAAYKKRRSVKHDSNE
ncbi:TPA: VaFE repeat-containing surface-anchored protein [Clostridioides difficile]|nr:VaFE repeat-containing surface-anchored protein [Clostridioides difficile]HBH4041770.1 VaFE repeat-containing surface-anchored protein [Clostridioides difficile]HCU2581801.1 VaFE repeat-containing surface-anchored protein [Clostridioides difficile]HCU2767185.1 VaFE repeat-containing surface-anchored protein [Clostridioides difficile]